MRLGVIPCNFPPSVVDGAVVINPDRPDRYKMSMDGLMRPRRWLAQDEIDALPAGTILWHNTGWGGVFPTQEDAAHCRNGGRTEAVAACEVWSERARTRAQVLAEVEAEAA